MAGFYAVTKDDRGRNLARIAGVTPLDQVGQTFSVNCTVIDISNNSVTGTALTKVWA